MVDLGTGETMFGERIASRLRRARRRRGLSQQVVADAVRMSVSAVSRLERGSRGLRVEQLRDWAAALGMRVEVLLWQPVPLERDHAEANGLSERELQVLGEVAAALPHMPDEAAQALLHEMHLWSHRPL
jgi:transcriptional regulator with XRE-family HTH domain